MAELVLIYDSVTGGIRANLLGAGHIVDASLASSKFGSGQVGQYALASPSVFSGQIASGQIGPHIASGGVLSAHFGSGQVGQYALASPSVFSGGIASGQVGQFALASPSVFSGGIASGQIGPHIASGGVLSAHFGSGQIHQFALGSGSVTSAHLASGQMGQFALAGQSVYSGAIASGTIDLLHLRRFEAGVLNLLSGPYTTQEVRAQWMNPTAAFGVGAVSATPSVVIQKIGWGDPNQASLILSDNPYGLDIGIIHPTQSPYGSFTRYIGEGSGATGVALLGGLFGSVEQIFGSLNVTTTNILSASHKIVMRNQSGTFEVATFLASGHRMFSLAISGVLSAGGLGLLSGILSSNIASGQVGGTHIAAGAVGAAQIFSGAQIYPLVISGSLLVNMTSGALAIVGLRGSAPSWHLEDSGPGGGGSIDIDLNNPGGVNQMRFREGAATLATLYRASPGNFQINSGGFIAPVGSFSGLSLGLTSGVLSGSIASGLAHHIEAFITSTDAGGFWSAAWKTAFGLSPAVTASPVRPLSGLARAVELFNITTALVNGITVNSGFIGAATSSVHVLAHDPTM